MAKVGWEGIEVLETKSKQEPKDEQLEIDKAYLRTFETEEGRKCLKHLISRTLDQPTWVPGGDHTFGYAREGQNSVVREIKTRMERAKNGEENQDQIQEEKKGEGLIADTPITDEPKETDPNDNCCSTQRGRTTSTTSRN